MPKPKKDKVATEEFVWRAFDSLRNEIDHRFDEVEEKFSEMNKKFDKMMEHIVDIAAKFKKFDESQEILSYRTYDNLKRIEKLEKSVFKSS